MRTHAQAATGMHLLRIHRGSQGDGAVKRDEAYAIRVRERGAFCSQLVS